MPQREVKFGIAVPQTFGNSPVDRGLIEDFLKRADQLAYHSVWVAEILDAFLLESTSLLTYAAAITRNLRLGSAVLLSALRTPIQLARTLATLDQLSGGRLIVGVALGSKTQPYPSNGLSSEHRVRRFLEGVALMKRLWTEEKVTYESEFWKLEDEFVNPKPLQKPHPPIWFGGNHPNALRRAVELGDGWIEGRVSTEQFKAHLKILRHFMGEMKRDPDTFMIAKRVYIAVDENRARAERRLNEWFSGIYGAGDLASSAAIYGDEQECIEKIGELIAEGAQLVLLNPVYDHIDHVEVLARHILPKLS